MNQPAQIPAFHVKTIREALAFYDDVLDFTKDWEWQHEDNLPIFASVTRGTHTLYLTEHEECTAGGLAYLYLQTPDDVNALADETKRRGGTPDYGPIDQPWKVREYQITDPFGNKLRFGGVLKEGDE